LWIAVPFTFAIGEGWKERLFLWPALSAGAILLHRFSADTAVATYHEDEENPNVLLRKGEKPVSDGTHDL
jgi:hypothetical protein